MRCWSKPNGPLEMLDDNLDKARLSNFRNPSPPRLPSLRSLNDYNRFLGTSNTRCQFLISDHCDRASSDASPPFPLRGVRLCSRVLRAQLRLPLGRALHPGSSRATRCPHPGSAQHQVRRSHHLQVRRVNITCGPL